MIVLLLLNMSLKLLLVTNIDLYLAMCQPLMFDNCWDSEGEVETCRIPPELSWNIASCPRVLFGSTRENHI